MRKLIFFLIVCFVLFSFTSSALIEQTPFWKKVGEWLTYSGNVKIEGNLSFTGDYINITVVNYNVTGDFAVDGNVSADYFLGNGSLMNSNIWNETAGKVYCANDNCNVGIGTDTPSQKLDVGGSAVFGSSPGAANDFIINPDYAGSGDLLVGTYIGGGSNAGNLNIIPTATGAEGTILSLGYYTGAVWESALQIANTAGGVFGNLTLMKDGGNVGIGTTSPEEELHIKSVSPRIILDSTDSSAFLQAERNDNLDISGMLLRTGDATSDWLLGTRGDSTSDLHIYSYGTSSNVLTILKASGNVGIGTDTPLAKLNVNGDLRVGYTGDRIQMDNLVANKMRVKSFSASLQLGSGYDGIYFTDSSDATVMRIQDDGNIGIGTDTPGTNVQVSGGTDAKAYSSSSSSTAAPWAIDNGTVVYIKSDKASVNNSAAYLGLSSKTSGSQTAISYIGNVAGTGSGTDIIGNAMIFGFRTDGASNYNERMRITNEGNVGIGTASPASTLDSTGTIRAIAGTQSAPSSGTGLEMFYTTSGGNDWGVLLAYDRTGSAYKPIRFDGSNYSFYTSGGTADVTIDSTGNVGIGTATPVLLSGSTDKLVEIQGTLNVGLAIHNTDASNQWFLYHDDLGRFNIFDAEDSLNRLVIDATGNVGIGTTTPKNNLQIADTVQLFETGSGAPSVLNLGRNIYNDGAWKRIIADNDAQLYQQPADTTFRWYQATDANVAADSAVTLTERMRIDAGGYVGIGATSPDEKLHVYDATEDTRIEVGSGTNNARVIINAGTASKFSILNLQHEGIDYWNMGSDGDNDQNFYIYSFNKTGGGDRVLSIDNEGYVGIGNTTPDHTVSVNGEIYAKGNVTAENVFKPQYIFSHTNETIPLLGASVWTNITFSQENADLKQGIDHDMIVLNHTFTINADGIYFIDYEYDIEDTSGASSDIDVAGRVIFSNGTEIIGSDHETGIEKKGVEKELTYDLLARLHSGDVIVFQFIATDADVVISTHGTFGKHPESAAVIIKKEANLP